MTQTQDDNFSPDMDVDEILQPFDVQDAAGNRAMLLLFLSCVAALIIALLFLSVYKSGVRDRTAPPVITADKTPFKVRPENPGGNIVPDQDKAIYDVMNGEAPRDFTSNDLPKSTNSGLELVPDDLQTELAQIEALPDEVLLPNVQLKPLSLSDPETTSISPSVQTSSSVVQVASVRSEALAQDFWWKLSAEFPTLEASGLTYDIQRADLDDKGVFYRLRVIGFANKTEATRLCEYFKTRNQACYVTVK